MDIPGYEIVEMLGVGGFGSVYRARQLAVRREVALKIDSRALATDRDRRRFMREVTAAGRLSGHPHVVAVYDAGVLGDGRPYMVLELCPGGSLNDRLHDGGPFPPGEVRDIGVRIAGALAAAHAAGVLHRDVKPANILIDQYGNVALADFGLASMPAPGMESSATREALTPAYAPPEAFRMDEPGPAGDVYSLAASLYALLSGRPPHFPPDRGLGIAELMHAQRQPLPDLPGVSAALTAVLRQGMAYEKQARIPDAATFRDALAAIDLAADPGPSSFGAAPPYAPPLPGVSGHPGSSATAPGGLASGAPVSSGSMPGAPVSGAPVSAGRISGGLVPGGSVSGGSGPAAASGAMAPPAPGHGPPAAGPATDPAFHGSTQSGQGLAHTRAPARQGVSRGLVLGAAAFIGAGLLGAGALIGFSGGGAGGGSGPASSSAGGPGTDSSGGGQGGGGGAGQGTSSPAGVRKLYGVETVTAGCPAAQVPGGQARCPADAECWGGMVIISGVVASHPRFDCTDAHRNETFAIALMPVDGRTDDYRELSRHPTVRKVCSKANLLRSLQGAAAKYRSWKWEIDVVPPGQEEFAAGARYYRCQAGSPYPKTMTSATFRPR